MKKLETGQAFRFFLACVHSSCLTEIASVQLSTTVSCLALCDRGCMRQGALWPCCSKILWRSKWSIHFGKYSSSQAYPIWNAGIQEYCFIPWYVQKWTDTLLVYVLENCGHKAGLDFWQPKIYVWKEKQMGLKRWYDSCCSIKAHVPCLLPQRCRVTGWMRVLPRPWAPWSYFDAKLALRKH